MFIETVFQFELFALFGKTLKNDELKEERDEKKLMLQENFKGSSSNERHLYQIKKWTFD